MAYATKSYTGNGATVNFALDFEYLDQAHVSVEVDGVNTAFTWLNASTVTVSPAPANDTSVVVFRNTSRGTPLVDYTNGQQLTQADLDLAYLHALYVAQEAFDASEAVENTELLQGWADAATAAAAAALISEGNALASATAAAISAAAALVSENAAASSETAADNSADAAAISAAAAAASAIAAAASAVTAAGYAAGSLQIASNLSDLNNATTARSNLGLGTMAVESTATYLTVASAVSTYLPITTAASDYVRKATQATISVSHILEQAGGAGAIGTYRNVDYRNANGNTNGKRWAWVTHKNSTKDELHLGLYSDADAYINSMLEFVRTGTTREYVRFGARALFGGAADDAATSLQTDTLKTTVSIVTPAIDASAGFVQAVRFLSAAAGSNTNLTGSVTIDLGAIEDYKNYTLTGNVTSLTFTLPSYPCVKRLIFLQGASAYTIATPSPAVGWDKDLSAAQKTIGTTVSKYNTLILMFDGVRLTGNWIREHA